MSQESKPGHIGGGVSVVLKIKVLLFFVYLSPVFVTVGGTQVLNVYLVHQPASRPVQPSHRVNGPLIRFTYILTYLMSMYILNVRGNKSENKTLKIITSSLTTSLIRFHLSG